MASMVDGSAGDAPHVTARRWRLRSAMSGRSHMACHCVGTRNMSVTCSDSRRSRTPAGSNVRDDVNTTVWPSVSAGTTLARPAMWKMGAAHSDVPPLPTVRVVRMKAMVAIKRLRWVSTAPFGRPVVPDVYMMTAGAAGSHAATVSGESGGSSGAPSKRSAHLWSAPDAARLAHDDDRHVASGGGNRFDCDVRPVLIDEQQRRPAVVQEVGRPRLRPDGN